LPWILAGGGVLVIGVVVVLIITLGGGGGSGSGDVAAAGSGSNSAEDVARAAVDAINKQDMNAGKEIACDAAAAGNAPSLSDLGLPPDFKFTAELTDVQENGNAADATVTINVSIGGQKVSQPMTLKLKKDGSEWCMSGVDTPALR